MLLKGHLTDSALLKISKLFLVRTGSNQVEKNGKKIRTWGHFLTTNDKILFHDLIRTNPPESAGGGNPHQLVQKTTNLIRLFYFIFKLEPVSITIH